MQLSEKYNIKFDDPLCITLQELKEIRKKGADGKFTGEVKSEWKDVAYYNNIQQLLNWIIDSNINSSGVETLKQMSALYRDLRDYVDEVFNSQKAEIISKANTKAAMILNDAEVQAERIRKDAKNKARREKK